jgi:HKD family nuclease
MRSKAQMITRTVTQPDTQLGREIEALLASGTVYTRIVFVSAFVALKTILRLRERLLAATEDGARLQFTVGIDLGGTSRDVLEELFRWRCETFVFHNPITRATFHPKIYLFKNESSASLFIGSNNLTDGGFYTNYEAATRFDFELPDDNAELERLLKPLRHFLLPAGGTVQRLDSKLIQTLATRGELPTEAEVKERRRLQTQNVSLRADTVLANPFTPASVPLPPLVPREARRHDPRQPRIVKPKEQMAPPAHLPPPSGILVWKKILPKSDALQVKKTTHHVGGVRLTQAGFENPPGQTIDQTTYFRRLFSDYEWEPEGERIHGKEHTFVPMRIIIRG